jgi:hypothetical protein
VDLQLTAGIVGGVVGAGGAFLAGWLDRRSREDAVELLAVEISAWEIAAVAGRLIVHAPEIRRAALSSPFGTGRWKLSPDPADAGQINEWLAESIAQLARSFAVIRARRSRYPRVHAAADAVMTFTNELVTTATSGDVVSDPAVRLLELDDDLHAAVEYELVGRRVQRMRSRLGRGGAARGDAA